MGCRDPRVYQMTAQNPNHTTSEVNFPSFKSFTEIDAEKGFVTYSKPSVDDSCFLEAKKRIYYNPDRKIIRTVSSMLQSLGNKIFRNCGFNTFAMSLGYTDLTTHPFSGSFVARKIHSANGIWVELNKGSDCQKCGKPKIEKNLRILKCF